MENGRFGGQVIDDRGQPVLEVGPHVVAEVVDFAANLGDVAAQWAHCEAELAGLLAALMATTPDRTFALLDGYKSAKATADAANLLGKATLQGAHLTQFEEIITRFRSLAEQRNKVQHGLWAKKSDDGEGLYRIKALEYTKFGVNMIGSADPIGASNEFLNKAGERYTVQRLKDLSSDIADLSVAIINAKNKFILSMVPPLGLHSAV